MGKKPLVAIDVGTTKVCCLVANVEQGGTLQVLGIGVTPSKGMHKGLIVNVKEAKETIGEAVKKAEHSSGRPINSAFVGITGRHISSLNTRGEVSPVHRNQLIKLSDKERALEAARDVKIPPNKKLLHIIPQEYGLNGRTKVKDPIGMHGTLSVKAHIITAGIGPVQDLLKCVRAAGVEVEDVILEPLASSEAVLLPDEKEAGIILADIGGGSTDVAVFRNGSIWHSAALPAAGDQITRDISIGLGIPFEVAEEIKKKHGRVMMDEEEELESQTINVAPGHDIVYKDLCEVIGARVEEILKLILLELPRFHYKSIIPAGVVLTGGTSNLLGIEAMGQEIFQLSVKRGGPRNVFGIASEVLSDPAYATGCGILLWGNSHKPGEGLPREGFFAGFGKSLRRFFFKFKKIFA